MNISELARKVHLNTKELREVFLLLGFDIGSRAIKVDNKVAQACIKKMSDKAVRGKILGELRSDDPDSQASDGLEKNAAEVSRGPGPHGEIVISSEIVVKELAKKLGINVTKLVIELMKQGVMASLTERIDFATASIIAEDLGFKLKLADELGEAEKAITDSNG